jgi:hypothetical protein
MSFTVDFEALTTAYAWSLMLLGTAALTIFAKRAGSFVKVDLTHVYQWLQSTEQFPDGIKAIAIEE